MVGRAAQRFNSRAHRFVGCPQNVDPIDFDVVDDANSPANLSIGNELRINFFAEFGRELLRIFQFPMPEFFRQNNSSSYDGSGQRAAAGFINSGNPADADSAQFFFVPKTAPPVHAA